jgi:ATP-dependent exoDNAse (exonuclease V) beta subunit
VSCMSSNAPPADVQASNAIQGFDPFNCPLFSRACIEASAGTGKTWSISVLAMRLIVEAKLTIEQVLLVTFTRAAVAELRERIRARLESTRREAQRRSAAKSESGSDSTDPFLQPLFARFELLGLPLHQVEKRCELALAQFEQASIFTIHGFCQRVLTQFAVSTQLPVEFSITSDGHLQVKALAQQALAQWFACSANGNYHANSSDVAWLRKYAAWLYDALQAQLAIPGQRHLYADMQPLELAKNHATAPQQSLQQAQAADGAADAAPDAALDAAAAAHLDDLGEAAVQSHITRMQTLWCIERNTWSQRVELGKTYMAGNSRLTSQWVVQSEKQLDALANQLTAESSAAIDLTALKQTMHSLQAQLRPLFAKAHRPAKWREPLLAAWLKGPLIASLKVFVDLNAHQLEHEIARFIAQLPTNIASSVSNNTTAPLTRLGLLSQLAQQAPQELQQQRERLRQCSFDDLLTLACHALTNTDQPERAAW